VVPEEPAPRKSSLFEKLVGKCAKRKAPPMKKKQKKKKVVEQGVELMNRKKMSPLSLKVTSTSQETETSETDR